MACHLAGVGTAVATCGTAFGDDHARVLRRFLNDHEEFRGEVIFTFDGDAAGQKAALRAFGGDQNFVSQTYVAVEPTGLDPCDLRIQQGDAAVRELVARAASALPLRPGQRRLQVRPRPGRRPGRRRSRGRPAGVVDPRQVQGRGLRPRAREHGRGRRRAGAHRGTPRGRRAARSAGDAAAPAGRGRAAAPSRPAAPPLPDLRTRGSRSSARPSSWSSSTRPASAAPPRDIGANDFTHPTYRAVWELVEQLGGPGARADAPAGPRGCATRATDPAVAAPLSALAVEPLLSRKGADDGVRRQHRLPAPGADRRSAGSPT